MTARSNGAPHKKGGIDLAGAIDRRETYNLIVVGGGISGLAAAHYFRQTAGPAAKILVLDKTTTTSAATPAATSSRTMGAPTSATAERAIDRQPGSVFGHGQGPDQGSGHRRVALRVGARLESLQVAGPRGRTFFDETFGADKLVAGTSRNASKEFLAQSPIPPQFGSRSSCSTPRSATSGRA